MSIPFVTWFLSLSPFETAMILSAAWGFFYNIANNRAEQSGFNDLYRPATIALGVAIELLILWPAIGWEAGLIAIGGFIIAGASMVSGGFISIAKNAHHLKSIKNAILDRQLERNRRAMEKERTADD